MEVLAGHDVGRGLATNPAGTLDIALFEDDRAFIVADGGIAGLPLNIVVGSSARLLPGGEVTRKLDSGASGLGWELSVQLLHYNCLLSGCSVHGDLLLRGCAIAILTQHLVAVKENLLLIVYHG